MSWKEEVKRDYDNGMLGKSGSERVNGMPLKTVKAMLKSPNTPEQIKNAWRAKLKLKGIVV